MSTSRLWEILAALERSGIVPPDRPAVGSEEDLQVLIRAGVNGLIEERDRLSEELGRAQKAYSSIIDRYIQAVRDV